ncbi:MAG: MFS transporter [Thermodesulfobacteriota bacterium]
MKLFYGWYIVIAGLFLIILDGLLLYSFGIFLPYLIKGFSLSTAAGASLFSVRCFVLAFSIMFAGRLIDKHNPMYVTFFGGLIAALGLFLSAYAKELWQLYITYSVMIGIGDGFLYIVPVTVISRWFSSKRALAIGIATTGVPISGLFVNPLSAWLIDSFGYQSAFIYLSFLFLVILSASFIIRANPKDMNLAAYGEKGDQTKDRIKPVSEEWSAKEAFSEKTFWLLYFIFFTGFNAFLIIIINLYNFCIYSGISAIVAAGAPAAIGLGSIIGRTFFSGFITRYLENTKILFVCYFFQACSILLLLVLSEVWTLYLFGFLFGFFYSGWVPMFPTILGSFYGLNSLGTIFGLFGSGFSVAALTGPLLAGTLFDYTNSYFLPFLLAAVFCFLTAFLTFLIKPPVKTEAKLT